MVRPKILQSYLVTSFIPTHNHLLLVAFVLITFSKSSIAAKTLQIDVSSSIAGLKKFYHQKNITNIFGFKNKNTLA